MPNTFCRRAFLGQGAAFAAGTLLARRGFTAGSTPDPNRFALLSDLHVSADVTAARQGANVSAKLGAALEQVQALDPLPSALLVSGDLAFEQGTPADYTQLQHLLRPVRERGVALHLALGNHDRREPFRGVFHPPVDRTLAERHAFVVVSPLVNWFVLDSLEPGSVSGRLGEAQLGWLASALDARAGKAAFVLLHHPPDLRPDGSGLRDTAALLSLLEARPQAKALFFGHTHAWSAEQREGIWCVNVPAVAYSFDAAQPTGWLDVRVGQDAAELVLKSLDSAHPRHGERVSIRL